MQHVAWWTLTSREKHCFDRVHGSFPDSSATGCVPFIGPAKATVAKPKRLSTSETCNMQPCGRLLALTTLFVHYANLWRVNNCRQLLRNEPTQPSSLLRSAVMDRLCTAVCDRGDSSFDIIATRWSLCNVQLLVIAIYISVFLFQVIFLL